MFQACTGFNSDIGHWDVSTITTMGGMFYGARSFNQDISNWDVSNVTSMSGMFMEADAFNQDISNWDVSNVTFMSSMFANSNSSAFNQDIGNWNVSNVTTTASMFQGATSFNQDISGWDVGQVTQMAHMFYGATSFNQDISAWNVGNVTSMVRMFINASSFNQDISNWDVSNVTTMELMFEGASAFNQNIGAWNVANVTNMASMLNNSGLSRENYDLTLTGWASQNIKTNVPLGASGLKYCDGETARNTLISGKGWNITGDIKYCPQTITFDPLTEKTYGDVFNLTAASSSGLSVTFSSSDPDVAIISGNTVTVAGSGTVTITASQDGSTNFEAASSAQQTLTVNPKPVTVTVNDVQGKMYREADPVLTYSANPTLINGDVFTGSLARVAGENAGTYAINQNTLTAGSNYTITFITEDFTIAPRAITVTADAGQSKQYGEADPVLTYSVSPALDNGEAFSGSLARVAGENVGVYAIRQNTLTAGSNYTIAYVGADFHITKLSQAIVFEPIPDKTLGEVSFMLVATASSSLPLIFTSSDESIAVISDNQVTIVGSGEVTITAIQPGNDIYDPQEVSVTLMVHPSSLFIPTLFSPDGNGVNDLFLVRGSGIEEIQFVVIDGMGNEVYRATDVNTATQKGWDGAWKGKAQSAGTYSWIMKGKMKNGASLSSQGKSYGQVVLMR